MLEEEKRNFANKNKEQFNKETVKNSTLKKIYIYLAV